jgi:hypothetical protein
MNNILSYGKTILFIPELPKYDMINVAIRYKGNQPPDIKSVFFSFSFL